MKIVLFGGSGMVGQIALRACFEDDSVVSILGVVRRPSGIVHPKYTEVVHPTFDDFSALKERVVGYDACLFCLGVSAAGMSESAYARITYDITLAAGRMLAEVNPNAMTFVYITGAGCDSSEAGRVMWARVKGKTENDLLRLPFKASYMFRPGAIIPDSGIRSKTKLYQFAYDVLRPLFPLMVKIMPNQVTTARQLGLAFLRAAKTDVPAAIGTAGHNGQPSAILEIRDINALALTDSSEKISIGDK